VLLSRDWVLTAGHCVWDIFAPEDPALFTVVAGDHVLSGSSGNERTRNAAQIVVHPNFGGARRVDGDVYRATLLNDVALIRVSQPFNLSSRVATIPLSGAYLPNGTEMFATGWGLTDPAGDEFTDVLQEVRTAVVDPAECANVMRAVVDEDIGPDSAIEVDGSHICMGKLAPDAHDACGGDSGGPLVARDASNNWTLVGITSWGALDCNAYGVYAHIRAVKPWIESVMSAGTVDNCSGRTIPGKSRWFRNDLFTGYPFVSPNTSACGTPEHPGGRSDLSNMYFTSLGGTSSHWTALGANTLINTAQDNFQVFLQQAGIYDELAETRKYHINWEEVRPFLSRSDLCTGRTFSGNTGWQQYNENGVYLDVYMGACPFSTTSAIFTSLGFPASESVHYLAAESIQGVTSIYPTTDGFRVYLRKPGITAAFAEQRGFQLNWQAIPYGTNNADGCVGRTSATNTPWVSYNGGSGLYVDVDTSACGETRSATYITSLGGTSRHWATTGVTSIYSPTSTGFRVYIKTTETPEQARANGWHVNWKLLRN
jgi:hypothetical protein